MKYEIANVLDMCARTPWNLLVRILFSLESLVCFGNSWERLGTGRTSPPPASIVYNHSYFVNYLAKFTILCYYPPIAFDSWRITQAINNTGNVKEDLLGDMYRWCWWPQNCYFKNVILQIGIAGALPIYYVTFLGSCKRFTKILLRKNFKYKTWVFMLFLSCF